MIGRITTHMTAGDLLANINQSMDRIQTTQQQLLSGERINQPSDAARTDMTNAVRRIRELTVQAANGTETPAGMSADADEVNQLIDQIKQDTNSPYNGQYVFSRAAKDRLQMASTRIQSLQLSDQTVLSNTQDADMAQTEIIFSTEQAALTAALQAGAHIVQQSLMDFLSG
jgi:flagellin-like hook-associated protein FlgL